MSDHGLRVIARVRPLSSSELAKKESSVISISGTSLAVRLDGQDPPARMRAYTQSKNYRVDCVLDEKSTQIDVFKEIEPLLQASLDGYNTTIFTYGQSGTGKTFSMLGYDLWAMARESLRKLAGAANPKNSRLQLQSAVLELATDSVSIGIIPRSMEWLFVQIDDLKEKRFSIKISVSYLEIHNEKLIDLLNTNEQSLSPVKGGFMTPNVSSKQLLDIREVNGDIFVAGLTVIEVQSAAEVLEILWIGAKARSIAVTDLNEYSSRSHTIFQAYLELSNENTLESFNSKISLVDLAGSEKLRVHQMTNFTPERIRELTSINKSLSSLSNCISALLQKSKGHVPYRDSKLTRLLQDSLGGNTKSAFVVTLSPSGTSFEETISTLQFADRVMRVSIETHPNRIMIGNSYSDANSVELQGYKNEIVELKRMVEFLLVKCGNPTTNLSDTGRIRDDEENQTEESIGIRQEQEEGDEDADAEEECGYEDEDVDDLTETTHFHALRTPLLAHKERITYPQHFDTQRSLPTESKLGSSLSSKHGSDGMGGNGKGTPLRIQNNLIQGPTDLLNSSSSLLYPSLAVPTPGPSSLSSSALGVHVPPNPLPLSPSLLSNINSSSSSRSIIKSTTCTTLPVGPLIGSPPFAATDLNNPESFESFRQFNLFLRQSVNVEQLRANDDRRAQELSEYRHGSEGWMKREGERIEDSRGEVEIKSDGGSDVEKESSLLFRGGIGNMNSTEEAQCEGRGQGQEHGQGQGSSLEKEKIELEWLQRYHLWLLSRNKLSVQSEKNSSSDEINSRMTNTTTLPANIAENEFENTTSKSHFGRVESSIPCIQDANNPLLGKNGLNTGLKAGAGAEVKTRAGVDEELSDRVRMMEMSMLLQAEELAIAKALFFKVREFILCSSWIAFVIEINTSRTHESVISLHLLQHYITP